MDSFDTKRRRGASVPYVNTPMGKAGAATSIGWWSIARPLLGLWVFVIGLKTLGEVHRFSAWRAGAALMIGNLVMGIAFVLVILAVMVGRGLA